MIQILDDTVPTHPAWRVLTSTAMSWLLLFLHRFYDAGQVPVVMPYSEVCILLGISRSTCARAIRELEQIGWIEVDRGEGVSHHFSRYFLSDIWQQYQESQYWKALDQRYPGRWNLPFSGEKAKVHQIGTRDKVRSEKDYRSSLRRFLNSNSGE